MGGMGGMPRKERVRRIEDDRIRWGQSARNLEAAAVVAPDLDGDQRHAPITHERNACLVPAKQERVGGEGNGIGGAGELQARGGISARVDSTARVFHIGFRHQSMRPLVERRGVAHQFALERLVRIGIEGEGHDFPGFDHGRVSLRH